MTRGLGELEHGYGERVTILDNPALNTSLLRIGQAQTPHPEIMALVRAAYTTLALVAFGKVMPRIDSREPTRMAEVHGDAGFWQGSVLDPSTRVVVLDVIRGGIVPAQVCFEWLTHVLPIENLRLDHVNMARVAGPSGHVQDVDLTGSKIGGGLEGRILVVPDPMGATGSTLAKALEHLSETNGQPEMVISIPLIATPEFLRRVLEAHPNMHVIAGRVDRGMSPPEVLDSVPGTHWDREKGLDEHDYIVPGAGGVGEVLNNSWC